MRGVVGPVVIREPGIGTRQSHEFAGARMIETERPLI